MMASTLEDQQKKQQAVAMAAVAATNAVHNNSNSNNNVSVPPVAAVNVTGPIDGNQNSWKVDDIPSQNMQQHQQQSAADIHQHSQSM